MTAQVLQQAAALHAEQRLAEVPAVVLLGARQTGKTTLALAVAERHDALNLDLESERDRAKLAEPELYLADTMTGASRRSIIRAIVESDFVICKVNSE